MGRVWKRRAASRLFLFAFEDWDVRGVDVGGVHSRDVDGVLPHHLREHRLRQRVRPGAAAEVRCPAPAPDHPRASALRGIGHLVVVSHGCRDPLSLGSLPRERGSVRARQSVAAAPPQRLGPEPSLSRLRRARCDREHPEAAEPRTLQMTRRFPTVNFRKAPASPDSSTSLCNRTVAHLRFLENWHLATGK